MIAFGAPEKAAAAVRPARRAGKDEERKEEGEVA